MSRDCGPLGSGGMALPTTVCEHTVSQRGAGPADAALLGRRTIRQTRVQSYKSVITQTKQVCLFSHSVSVTLCSLRSCNCSLSLLSGKLTTFVLPVQNYLHHYTTLFQSLLASDSFRQFFPLCKSSSKEDLMFIVQKQTLFLLFVHHALSLSVSESTEVVTSWTIFCLVWSNMPITWRSW